MNYQHYFDIALETKEFEIGRYIKGMYCYIYGNKKIYNYFFSVNVLIGINDELNKIRDEQYNK